MLIAVVFLAGVILWQSGYLDSFGRSNLGMPAKKEGVKTPTPGKPQKRPVPNKSEGIPAEFKTPKSDSPPPIPAKPEKVGSEERPKTEAPAFMTKEGAEEQQKDLESKGIQSQVVER